MSDTAVLRIRVESSGISAASSDLQRLSAQGGATENSLLRLKNIVFAVGAAMGVDTVIRYSDAWTTVTNKLANVRKESESLADVQSRVFSIAQNSNSSLEATAALYSRLEPATKKLVKSGEELGGITETINKAMIVSGAATEEAAGAVTQLSQGLISGALRGDEFNSVNEAAPRLMQAVADSLGVTRGELRGYAAQGQLTSEVIINAMREQADAIDAEFSRMNATFEQKGVKAYNNMVKSIGENNDLASATSAAGDALLGLSENVDTVVLAGEVMAAVYGSRLVGSLATATQSKIATTVASRSLAMGEVQAAQAAVAQTVAEKANAIAAQQSLVSQLALAQTEKTRTTIRLLLAENSAVVTAAVNAETAATERLTVAQAAANTTARAGAGALALIGGPAGAAMLAATAIYYLYQKSEEAGAEAVDFANKIDLSTAALERLTPAAQVAAEATLIKAVSEQTQEFNKQKEKVAELAAQYEQYTKESEAMGFGTDGLKDKYRELMVETDNLEKKESALHDTKYKLDVITRALNGVIGQSVGVLKEDGDAADIAAGMHRELNRVLGIQLDTKKQLNDFKYVVTDDKTLSSKGEAYLAKLDQENEVLKEKTKERQEYLKAFYAAKDAGLSESEASSAAAKAVDNWKLDESQKATEKSATSAAQAQERLAEQYKKANDSIADMTIELQANKLEVQGNARAGALLTAEHEAQKQGVGELTDKYVAAKMALYDYQKEQEALANRKSATDWLGTALAGNSQEAQEKNNYDQQLQELRDFAKKKALTKQEITNAETALEKTHQENLKKIKEQYSQSGMSVMQSSFQVMIDATKTFAGEESAIYKGMFLAQQAFQVVSIMANAETAAAAMLAHDAGFLGLGAVASSNIVRGMGYASAGVVAGMALGDFAGAFDNGGYIPAGKVGIAAEYGDELVNGTLVQGPANVISRKDTAAMLNNESSGGNVVQMTVHQTIQVTGNGDANLVAAMQQAANQGAQMAYQAVATDFKDNKGIRRLV